MRLILLAAAIAVEGAAAYAALPAAVDNFGIVAGSTLTTGIAIGLFFSWLTAFQPKLNIYKRAVAAGVGVVLLSLTSLAVYVSSSIEPNAQLLAQRNAEIQKIEADYQSELTRYYSELSQKKQLHMQSEQARLESLARINREIQATKKDKQPEIYQQLLSQQSDLSVAIPAPILEQPVKAELPPLPKLDTRDFLKVASSLSLGMLSAVLIMLAQISAPNDRKPTAFARSSITSDRADRIKKQAAKSGDELTAFELRKIPVNPQGEITMQSVCDYFQLSDRQGRNLRAKALKARYLYKKSNRYYYAEAAQNNVESWPQNARLMTGGKSC